MPLANYCKRDWCFGIPIYVSGTRWLAKGGFFCDVNAPWRWFKLFGREYANSESNKASDHGECNALKRFLFDYSVDSYLNFDLFVLCELNFKLKPILDFFFRKYRLKYIYCTKKNYDIAIENWKNSKIWCHYEGIFPLPGIFGDWRKNRNIQRKDWENKKTKKVTNNRRKCNYLFCKVLPISNQFNNNWGLRFYRSRIIGITGDNFFLKLLATQQYCQNQIKFLIGCDETKMKNVSWMQIFKSRLFGNSLRCILYMYI